MINKIYLKRKNKLILEKGEGDLRIECVATLAKNLECLGYALSKEIMDVLQTYTMKDLMEFYNFLVYELKVGLGAHRNFMPMYPNFPAQVMEADEVELYLNAIIHYMTLEKPKYNKKDREPLVIKERIKVIKLGDIEDLRDIFKNMLRAKIALSPDARLDLGEYLNVAIKSEDIEEYLPDDIPNKENLAFIISYVYSKKGNIDGLEKYFKIAQDVLRVCVGISEGDVSLACPTRFKSFKRGERRMILNLLEGCENIREDMLRHREAWVRLGERLHPGEYKNKFPKCFEAFKTLRNNIKIETFNRSIENYIREEDINGIINTLSKRPGEFARRLNKILGIGKDQDRIIEAFGKVAHRVSSTVMLQIYQYFKSRNVKQELRTFFPKGNTAKVFAIEDKRESMDENIRCKIERICENSLKKYYSEKDNLGKVFVHEDLKKYTVPFSQRSASKSLKTIPRGSRVPLGEGNIMRYFLWWRDNKFTGRIDIDLSVTVFDEDWGMLETVTYYNLRSEKFGICHSGDIVEAPEGACEFIDVDKRKFRENGGKYIVLTVHSFTSHKYCDLPECFAGWMCLESGQRGEIFEPSEVENKFDLSADAQIALPMVVDLESDEVIWSDMALTRSPRWVNNVEGNSKGIFLIGKSMTCIEKANLYDLFTLHGCARGEIVTKKEDADTVFSVDEGITPYDIENIIANYL